MGNIVKIVAPMWLVNRSGKRCENYDGSEMRREGRKKMYKNDPGILRYTKC